ncbi:hypothetical protein ACROYT_G025859 [Oculina patagonica]
MNDDEGSADYSLEEGCVEITLSAFTLLLDKTYCNSVIDLFLQDLTMVRLPVAKSCFLKEGIDDVPKPADLKKLLMVQSKDVVAITKPQTEVKLKVIATLEDRSQLNDEMANMCAKLPIYVVGEGEPGRAIVAWGVGFANVFVDGFAERFVRLVVTCGVETCAAQFATMTVLLGKAPFPILLSTTKWL